MSDEKNVQRQAQVDKLISGLMSSTAGRQMIENSMKAQGVAMRNIISFDSFPVINDPVRLSFAGKGVILDVETTGLDHNSDEIIELGMLSFYYDEHGIIKLDALFDEFNEPQKKPIDDEISALTGITNEMVAGKRINPEDVKAFLAGTSFVAAHHANFDRKMVEANLPDCGFQDMAWHCSVAQVEWLKRGKSGRSLEVLAMSENLVYGSHRADADCLATAFILNSKPEGQSFAFLEMVENGDRDTIFLIADKSPFEAKDVLKARGYSWAAEPSQAFGYKAWHIEIPATPEAMADEAKFLVEHVYRREAALPSFRIDAKSRYSARTPAQEEIFRTKEVVSLLDVAEQMDLDHNTAPQM